MARVVDLLYYPVKGCAAVSTQAATVLLAGLAHDRSFMVVSEKGVSRTQRRDPQLALIAPEVSADGRCLTLQAAGYGSVPVDVDTTGLRQDVGLLAPGIKASTRGLRPPSGSRTSLVQKSQLVRAGAQGM
ncbi:MOSC domain-containing protein [Nocardia sp. CA-129566]|uniref:MOSC domain-containing protein n=1 Tax=Nocardia sp. CA-129566 TaxID=3239976 RepID=UPI003D997918